MEILEYPFDSQMILRTKRKIRRELLASGGERIRKRIAILGGSTTAEIRDMLELFLLDAGIEPSFYESGYGRYWQDVMFDEPELAAFRPDIICIHTTSRNISTFPEIGDSPETVETKLHSVFDPFRQMWDKAAEVYHCPIIQNNFERPRYRLMGSREIADIHGKANFVQRLNELFYGYAQQHSSFHIHDIDFLAASYGLQRWADPTYWYMYKYAPAVPAIPELAFSITAIIRSIFGKTKKALVLDLDNTLWGGTVGDDGAEGIEIGPETPMGELYSEIQQYIRDRRSLGTLLAVDSKNDPENALAGLSRPDSVLKPEDFLVIKANWEPKDKNLTEIAAELNIGTDALVFADDNPAERHIIRSQVSGTAVPEFGEPQDLITALDRSGYFEMTGLSEDDLHRNEMYRSNIERSRQQAAFTDYREYLLSLGMKAEITPFSKLYMARIAQLTNKSNQFNLTTRRCTEAELEQIAADPNCITLYGKLEDRFGDNGVVTVVFGHKEENAFHIDEWLMSCRVLKRDMELAMMDELAARCLSAGVTTVFGYYIPTKKNRMTAAFYGELGFEKIREDESGSSIWKLDISSGYRKLNGVIEIKKEE